MAPPADRTLLTHLATLTDPRVERTKLHPLENILTIAICAVICGAESWDDIAAFGEARADWFGTFLDLSHGIPSHDTFNRVFAALDPAQFETCFLAWVRAARLVLPAQVIALDGKTVRRSHDRHRGKPAIQLVSAWAAEQQLVLAQTKMEHKTNEIAFITELLRALELTGCLVTLDAMGCQRAITEQGLNQGGDYVPALKDNQPTLAADVQTCFDQAQTSRFAGVQHDYHEAVNKGHRRLELRRRWVITDPDVLAWVQDAHRWPGLQAIGMVQTERRLTDTTPVGTRYYLLSRPLSAQTLWEAVRGHWGIGNAVHWVLDMSFGEDQSRIHQGRAAENAALLCRVALNVLRQHPWKRHSIKARCLIAGWNDAYRLQVLMGLAMRRPWGPSRRLEPHAGGVPP
jgi:predicted transposase YbfD/YdcC